MTVESEALARLTPDAREEQELAAVVARLEAQATAALRAAGAKGRAAVQGSAAKGTWLRGGADIDLFLLLDPATPAERLEAIALEVGPRFLTATRRRYAQHPYLMGTFEGFAVDLVPAYAVADAGARMSAVDRTPFHTAWVRGRLDAAGRAEVRLAKGWLKGVGSYGAQTETGGFSGYLVEVLIAHFGTFASLLQWLAGGAQPRHIDFGRAELPPQVEPAALTVIDPVDPRRNCAAAVQPELLAATCSAARDYLRHPRLSFFFPPPRGPAAPTALHSALAHAGLAWNALLLRPRTTRLDIVFPQFQKSLRTIGSALAEAGFPVQRQLALHRDDGREVLLQWLTGGGTLPASRLHMGPAPTAHPGAERFRAKWEASPAAVGPVHEVEGHLAVEVRTELRDAASLLAARLPSLPLGRHVTDALPGLHLRDPAEAPLAWGAAVADFVLGRHPWDA